VKGVSVPEGVWDNGALKTAREKMGQIGAGDALLASDVCNVEQSLRQRSLSDATVGASSVPGIAIWLGSQNMFVEKIIQTGMVERRDIHQDGCDTCAKRFEGEMDECVLYAV